MDGPPGLRLQLVDDHPTGVADPGIPPGVASRGDARDVPDAPEAESGPPRAARAASSENEAVTDLPRRAVTRTAKLASLPLGFAGRTALGFGKRVGGRPGGGRGRGGAGPHRRAAVQGARRAQGRRDEVRAGPEHLRGRAAGGARRPLPGHADQAAGRRAADARRDRAQGACRRVRPPLAQRGSPSFDDKPAAAASIGQVHRAVWADGRPVAVKVQYPGAGEALISDFKQVARVARVAAGWIPGLDIKPVLDELKAPDRRGARLRARGRRPRRRSPRPSRGDPVFVVPDVVAEQRPSDRQRVARRRAAVPAHRLRHEAGARSRGPPLHGVPARRTRPRRAAARRPAPGNYRITDDGRFGVLDFGAVKRLPDGLPPRDRRTAHARTGRGRRGRGRGPAGRGLHQGLDQHRRRQPARLPVTVPRARAARVVDVLTRVDAGAVLARQRPAAAAVVGRSEDQPAAGVPADPPGVDRRHRSAVPDRGRGAGARGPRSVVAELRPGRARRGARRAARRGSAG